MSTDRQKIFLVYTYLLNEVEDNYKVANVCPCLIEVLEEISTSNEMRQLVANINNKSPNLSSSLLAMLQAESSENLEELYDFVQLL